MWRKTVAWMVFLGLVARCCGVSVLMPLRKSASLLQVGLEEQDPSGKSAGAGKSSGGKKEGAESDGMLDCGDFGPDCKLTMVPSYGYCCAPTCENSADLSFLQLSSQRQGPVKSKSSASGTSGNGGTSGGSNSSSDKSVASGTSDGGASSDSQSGGKPAGCPILTCRTNEEAKCNFKKPTLVEEKADTDDLPFSEDSSEESSSSGEGSSSADESPGEGPQEMGTKKCSGPCIPKGECNSPLEYAALMMGNCAKVTCEDCTFFVNSLWDKADSLLPHVKDLTDSKHKSTLLNNLAPKICSTKPVAQMAYGWDKCTYFMKDEVAAVVKGIQDDLPAWEICTSMAKGKAAFFKPCSSAGLPEPAVDGAYHGGTSMN